MVESIICPLLKSCFHACFWILCLANNFVFDRRNLVHITVFIFVPCQKKLITINSFISMLLAGGGLRSHKTRTKATNVQRSYFDRHTWSDCPFNLRSFLPQDALGHYYSLHKLGCLLSRFFLLRRLKFC